LQCWDVNSGPTPWATLSVSFYCVFFQDKVFRMICPGLASSLNSPDLCPRVDRITGVSNRHPASVNNLSSIIWVKTV
jgi:hypothetical protein